MQRTKTSWENKFREPPIEDLLTHFPNKQLAGVMEAARDRLTTYPNVVERVQWLGMPWRWAMVYSCEPDPTRALAYLVPDPAKVQISIPLTTAMLQTMPIRRLRKVIRDGILYSKFVAGTYWPCWEVTSRNSLDDLLDLVSRKHKYIHLGVESLAGTS